MTEGMNFTETFRTLNKKTVFNYLNNLGLMPDVYSNRLRGIKPYLKDNVCFVYATRAGVAVVCLDCYGATEELADEEPYDFSEPQYFTEKSHRTSPVWQLSQTVRLAKLKLEESGLSTAVTGLLLSESKFINAQDMRAEWEDMDVTVIDCIEFDEKLLISVLPDEESELGQTVMTALRTLHEPAAKRSDAETQDDFQTMLDRFLDETSGEKQEATGDAPDETDGKEDSPREAQEETTCLPSGIIEQNANTTVKVKILPPMQNAGAELDRLVGCRDIKKRIDELLALTRFNQMMQSSFPGAKTHEVSLHSIFFGRPGTGKTTVCKIFGSLLHEAGALSKGHVVVADRSAFIGTLWGDEERSVSQLLEMARGGVLMIDEAYLLDTGHRSDPGKLALQLLMNLLADEEQRDIAIVLCGYKEPMMRLLDTNPGLGSRFPNRFEFPDFSIDELMEITRRRIREYQYRFTRQAWEKYRGVLTAAYQVRDEQTWGNARFVSNQLERIFIQHAQRCVRKNPSDARKLLTLTPADIAPVEVPRAKRRIGF